MFKVVNIWNDQKMIILYQVSYTHKYDHQWINKKQYLKNLYQNIDNLKLNNLLDFIDYIDLIKGIHFTQKMSSNVWIMPVRKQLILSEISNEK